MKTIVSFSVDTELIEEFQKRVSKNHRSEWLEKRMREFVDHNRYEIEKTKQELEDTLQTAKMLKNQIKDMEEARKQQTLRTEELQEALREQEILYNVSYYGIDEWMKRFGGAYAKRFKISEDELRTAILDQQKSF
jgi:predicted transcriptional regulator